jgi:hypothetical protein
MGRNKLSRMVSLAALGLAVAGGVALGAPVDSDLAVPAHGGGCYPIGLNPSLFDMLTLINPEWAPLENGMTVASTPITVHGVVQEMHGDLSGDFPSTHLRADVNEFLLLDPEDADRLATGNDDGLLHFEWEAGVYPAPFWAGEGDRVVAQGRWIFDCGHPGAIPGNCSVTTGTLCARDQDCVAPSPCPTCVAGENCVGVHYAYSAELHPPQAAVSIRSGRGAKLSRVPGIPAIPVTRADVYVSPAGGGAGDACVLGHLASDLNQLTTQCFPLAQPLAPLNAQDFVFDVPLPPKPPGGRVVRRITKLPAPGGVEPRIKIKRRLVPPAPPHLEVHVLMTRPVKGAMPTGFAGTIEAGWRNDPTPLTHVRLTIDSITIENALQPGAPSVPKTCSVHTSTPCDTAADCPTGEACWGAGPVKAWQLQAAMNGQWQELVGLGSVSTNDVIPEGLVFDQYLPAAGAAHFLVNGRSHECIDTMYGKSLADGIVQLGITKGIACLATNARDPGGIDVTYAAPDFGAGSGTMAYAMTSAGGQGGRCSLTTAFVCTVDADCPSGETCVETGGAFTVAYHVDRLP